MQRAERVLSPASRTDAAAAKMLPPSLSVLLPLRVALSGVEWMGEGGREGERARVVPGSHTSLPCLPSFLPSASHSLSLFSLLAAFSSLPISNEKRKQFKAPARTPALARQKRCTSMYFPRYGGRGTALLLLEGRSVDVKLECLVDCASTNTTTTF